MPRLSPFMKYRTLGKTGLKVSEVGFGAWGIGGNDHGNSYGPADDKVSLAAGERAIERGSHIYNTTAVSGQGKPEQPLDEAPKIPMQQSIITPQIAKTLFYW